MKHFLTLIALCFTILATAKNGKEIAFSNLEKPTIEENRLDNVKACDDLVENATTDVLDQEEIFGCGSSGNSYYNILRSDNPDMSHREARAARRAFVRDCRGGPVWVPWPWE